MVSYIEYQKNGDGSHDPFFALSSHGDCPPDSLNDLLILPMPTPPYGGREQAAVLLRSCLLSS